MAHFGPKPQSNPFGKMSIFGFFSTSIFYSLQRCFFVLQYHKTEFPSLYCPQKRWENGQFWTKTMDLPLRKISNFRLFKLLFLQPTNAFFRFKIKWPILDQNHRQIPLEKWQFFDFLNFFFFVPQKGVFSFQNIVKHIFLAYIA